MINEIDQHDTGLTSNRFHQIGEAGFVVGFEHHDDFSVLHGVNFDSGKHRQMFSSGMRQFTARSDDEASDVHGVAHVFAA